MVYIVFKILTDGDRYGTFNYLKIFQSCESAIKFVLGIFPTEQDVDNPKYNEYCCWLDKKISPDITFEKPYTIIDDLDDLDMSGYSLGFRGYVILKDNVVEDGE